MNTTPAFAEGSGNVFEDLGFEQPDLELAKADLARQITRHLKAMGLTQAEAGRRLELDQPKVSRLTRGMLGEFSIERLMFLLTRLDCDVAIVVQPKTPSTSARIHVQP